VPAATRADIDRILEAIRAEARARGSKGRVGMYSTDIAVAGAAPAASHGLHLLETTHAADFLALPLDVFLGDAYRAALGRDPDPAGAAHYQRMLLRGRITRIEVLGRLALSAEGRRSGLSIPGLVPAFLAATFYRIPLAGPVAAVLARALKLPPHWQDRSAIEAIALATGSWMKR
jgi:O-antigen chain-terminating methyltransferase